MIIIFDIIKIFRLYVLKDQIDKVKTRKEALANALADTTGKENKEENVYPTIDTLIPDKVSDETAAISLPIVDTDGKIKENTSELPVVKDNRKLNLEQPFETIAIDMDNLSKEDVELATPVKKLTEEKTTKNEKTDHKLPVTEEEKIDYDKIDSKEIPRLNKNSDTIPVVIKKAESTPINRVPLQRNKIKRR